MTNQLFRDLLDGRIPMARKRIRPGIYFLPSLRDPSAPTLAELNAGMNISHVVTIDGWDNWAKDHPVWPNEPETDPRARALANNQNRNHGPRPDTLRERGRVTRYKEKP